MIKTLIFKLIIFAWFVLCIPFVFIGLISAKLERFIALGIARGTLFLTRIFGGIKYEVHYPPITENGIPFQHNINTRLDGRAIIASKHMSVMEVLILFTQIPNSFFIIKRELLWIPFYGWAFHRIGLVGVNRKRGSTNMKKLVHQVTKKIMDGMILIIFPEGTRTYPNQPVKIKNGLLFLAQQLKLPIIPVYVDTGLYWPKRGRIKSGTTHVCFGKELPSSATTDQIQAAINTPCC